MQDAVSGVPECICQVIQKTGLWNFGMNPATTDGLIFFLSQRSFIQKLSTDRDLCNLVKVIAASQLTSHITTHLIRRL